MSGIVMGGCMVIIAGIPCGLGYLVLGIGSGCTFLLFRKMKLAQDVEDSVKLLQSENSTLKNANAEYESLNASLTASNDELQEITGQLQNDIDIITETIRTTGEKSADFMKRLREAHERLKAENDKHEELNRRQAILQLLQLFQHFDKDNDLLLTADELAGNSAFLEAAFPKFRLELLQENSFTFTELMRVIL